MQIGAQLYTARKYTQTLEDFSETLKKVADIGYKVVQVSGTCPYEPEWLREELAKNGLKCVLTHTTKQAQLEGGDKSLEEVVAFHAIYGCKNIGVGGIPGSFGELSEASYELYRDKYVPIV